MCLNNLYTKSQDQCLCCWHDCPFHFRGAVEPAIQTQPKPALSWLPARPGAVTAGAERPARSDKVSEEAGEQVGGWDLWALWCCGLLGITAWGTLLKPGWSKCMHCFMVAAKHPLFRVGEKNDEHRDPQGIICKGMICCEALCLSNRKTL